MARIPAQQRHPGLQRGRGRPLHRGGGAERVRGGGGASSTGRAEGLFRRAEGQRSAALRADVDRKVAIGAGKVALPSRRVADEERAREVNFIAAVELLLHAIGGCNPMPERLQPYTQERLQPYA